MIDLQVRRPDANVTSPLFEVQAGNSRLSKSMQFMFESWPPF